MYPRCFVWIVWLMVTMCAQVIKSALFGFYETQLTHEHHF